MLPGHGIRLIAAWRWYWSRWQSSPWAEKSLFLSANRVIDYLCRMKLSLSRVAIGAVVLCSCLAFQTTQAQERIKVLSYNVLNYPNPDYDDYRADTLKKIIEIFKPDIFLMQELKHPRGIDSILAIVFNTTEGDNFQSGTWLWQVSAPWSSWKLQQNVIYDADKLTLISEGYVQTGTRDHNVFKFMVNDPNLHIHQDTTFLYALSVHLKASQGASNVAERLQMVQILTNYLENLEPNAHVVLAGDFNVYNSSEPAYQHLISGSTSTFVFADPIDTPGNWHDSPSLTHVHTQSTRTSQLNGDGAGGGLDDRFDFILLSENMMNTESRIHYVEDTYDNIGYTGGCLNQSLMACTNSDVTLDVRRALFQMSDHLPVWLELDVNLPLPTSTNAYAKADQFYKGANPVRETLVLSAPDFQGIAKYHILDMLGNVLSTGTATNSSDIRVDVSSMPSGMYLFLMPQVHPKPYRFVKIR